MILTDIRQITNKIIKTTAQKTTILHTTNLKDIEILGLLKNKNDQYIIFYFDCNNETFYKITFEIINKNNVKIINIIFCQYWAFDPFSDFLTYLIDENYFKIWIEKDIKNEIDETIENDETITEQDKKKLLQFKECLRGF